MHGRSEKASKYSSGVPSPKATMRPNRLRWRGSMSSFRTAPAWGWAAEGTYGFAVPT
jgi:hypothetical protein